MGFIVKAIYEKGVLRPLQPVDLREHQKVNLILFTEDEAEMASLVDKQRAALREIIGLGASGLRDVAEHHDRYLYGRS